MNVSFNFFSFSRLVNEKVLNQTNGKKIIVQSFFGKCAGEQSKKSNKETFKRLQANKSKYFNFLFSP